MNKKRKELVTSEQAEKNNRKNIDQNVSTNVFRAARARFIKKTTENVERMLVGE